MAAIPPVGPVESPEVYAEKYVLADEIVRDLRPRAQALRDEATRLTAERNAMNVSWAGVKQLIEARRADVRKKDVLLSEQAAAQAVEIKLHKQRVRELLSSNAKATVGERVAALRALKTGGDKAAEGERELRADLRDAAVALKEIEVGHEELLRVFKLENDKAITTLRFSFEAQARELASLYVDRMRRTRDDLNLDRETSVAALEARKSAHTGAMLAAHERAFSDMKAYFNDITHSSLDLIKVRDKGGFYTMRARLVRVPVAHAITHTSLRFLPFPPPPQSLKEELRDMQKKEAGDEKVVFVISAENKRMSEPMRKAIDDVRTLREERADYRLNVVALQETKAAGLVLQDRLDALKWEHEILSQRTDRVVSERDALAAKFSEAIHEIQQKAGFKNLLLEQKLAAATNEGEHAQLLLAEMLSKANIDPATVGVDPMALERGAKTLQTVRKSEDTIYNITMLKLTPSPSPPPLPLPLSFSVMNK
jgi:hypothetical protein